MAQPKPTARTSLRVVSDTESCYPDWETVYADNAIWVYRMIVRRIGNVPDAEDLTAEVFLAALRPLRTTATVAQVRGYLRASDSTRRKHENGRQDKCKTLRSLTLQDQG